jgi:hypothetical protein
MVFDLKLRKIDLDFIKNGGHHAYCVYQQPKCICVLVKPQITLKFRCMRFQNLKDLN